MKLVKWLELAERAADVVHLALSEMQSARDVEGPPESPEPPEPPEPVIYYQTEKNFEEAQRNSKVPPETQPVKKLVKPVSSFEEVWTALNDAALERWALRTEVAFLRAKIGAWTSKVEDLTLEIKSLEESFEAFQKDLDARLVTGF
jgi:hypothetical protein